MSTFDREKMAEVQRNVVRAIDERNPLLFATLYTEAGALLPSDGRVVRGRNSIADFFGNWLTAGFVKQTLADVELTVGDAVAVEEGLATAGYADGSEISSRYLVVHVRQDDGSWLMHRDIWTQVGHDVAVEVS
ncbi:MAG: SgcJ/EcaC family oxidoreductase [Rhodococcus sp. (in: high G+C Gram-positive bacteria)]